MTINDKRRKIIENWTATFIIEAPQSPGYRGEYWYGRLFINPLGPGGVIGPYTTEGSVIFEAYNLVRDSVWKMVNDD